MGCQKGFWRWTVSFRDLTFRYKAYWPAEINSKIPQLIIVNLLAFTFRSRSFRNFFHLAFSLIKWSARFIFVFLKFSIQTLFCDIFTLHLSVPRFQNIFALFFVLPFRPFRFSFQVFFQVCQNDIMVIDVVNRIPGQSFGIHWRGQSQKETPFMDGVPMITQCPIPSFTTFQYKFRATNPGTHMWQVNTGEEALETQFGGFVVRQPDSRDPSKHLYDTDDPSHIITVHSWSTQRRSPFLDDSRSKLFINGKVEVRVLFYPLIYPRV